MRQIPKDIADAAVKAMKATGVLASLSIAQWALESGWGSHSPGNNPFGMKPRHGKEDPFLTLQTFEYENGVRKTVDQPFRKFDSIADAFVAHAELLSTAPVYHAAMLALPDRDKFIDLVAKHYATAPNYAIVIKSIIKSNQLEKYDA